MKDNEEITLLVNKLRKLQIDSYNGLPEELFLFISSMVPIPNIDLWITNDKNQILLSWRDDEYYGKGWHFPGGCIRYGETMMERVQKTALEEVGTHVVVQSEKPIAIKDVIRGENDKQMYKKERGHNITILFKCRLPEQFEIDNKEKKQTDRGYLKWFDDVPDNILKVHAVYNEIFKEWKDKGI